MLENKYLVPCNYIAYLKAQFGDNYLTPKNVSKYPALDYINKGEWTAEQLPYVFRSYDESGKVDEKSSLRIVNNDYMSYVLKVNLTKLPPNNWHN